MTGRGRKTDQLTGSSTGASGPCSKVRDIPSPSPSLQDGAQGAVRRRLLGSLQRGDAEWQADSSWYLGLAVRTLHFPRMEQQWPGPGLGVLLRAFWWYKTESRGKPQSHERCFMNKLRAKAHKLILEEKQDFPAAGLRSPHGDLCSQRQFVHDPTTQSPPPPLCRCQGDRWVQPDAVGQAGVRDLWDGKASCSQVNRWGKVLS